MVEKIAKNGLETSLNIAVTPEFLSRRIFLIRGMKVMLDRDLAELYQVSTGNLNLSVKRNLERFPPDFMFQLTKKEYENLIFQFATSSWGGTRKLPYAFTELGVAMLSSVLHSDRAVQMNIYIMRAFVKLRELLATNADLAKKIEELEKGQREHSADLVVISKAINKLIEANRPRKNAIGFEV